MNRMRVDVIRRPEYIISYSQWREMTFAHVHVTKWTRKSARQFLLDVNDAQRLLDRAVFALETPTGSNKKFLTRHGFVPCGRAPTDDGDVRPIYVRKPHG